MNLTFAFNTFIQNRTLAGLTSKTILCYKEFVGRFIKFVGYELEINALDIKIINEYLMSVVKSDISMNSKATYIRHTKIFLVWLEHEFCCSLSAKAIKVPRSSKKMLDIYSDSDIQKIFDSVVNSSEWLRLRNICIICFMLDSGLRQNEISLLERKDINFIRNICKVTGKGNKERFVPIGKYTAVYLKKYYDICPFDGKYVFVSKPGDRLSCDAIKRFVYKLSLRLDFEFSSHKLRHNFATNYCLDCYTRTGQIDIYKLMLLLGHSDVATTRRYLHVANQIIISSSSISHLDGLTDLQIKSTTTVQCQ